jgi:nucleotidyltransferase/DNA polymerase involved in DNA repair
VTPKSIDEAVIDLTDTLGLFKGSILDIGKQIKKRFREEIGEWMVCSIGVSTNRFLAKLAASLHKRVFKNFVTREGLGVRSEYGTPKTLPNRPDRLRMGIA